MISQLSYLYQQAWASLKLKPAFITGIVTTLGITFGVLLSVLTLAYMLLIKPLPYPQQDKLFQVNHEFYDDKGALVSSAFTYQGLLHLYQEQQVFDQASLLYYISDVISSHPSQAKVNTTYVTPQWFSLLDIPLYRGRGFSESEQKDSFNPVAVISYQSWQSTFAAAENILEQNITIRGISYRIIGVTGKTFIEAELFQTGRHTDIWLPWDFNWTEQMHWGSWDKTEESTVFIGKLKTQYSPEQAEQVLATTVNDAWQENIAGNGHFKGWHIGISLQSLKDVLLASSKTSLIYLITGVLGLVLIALVNIANLFMSRTIEQSRTLAIHGALGARKKQIFYNIFSQTSLLMALSMALALFIASGCFTLMQRHLATLLPRVNELTINSFTLTVTLSLLLFLAWLFAAISTRMINYRALNLTLQNSGKNTGIQISTGTRKSLISTQVGVATVLIFINLVLFQHAYNTLKLPSGFEIDNSLQLRLTNVSVTSSSKEETLAVLDEVKRKLLQYPQVDSVSRSLSPLIWFGLMPTTLLENNHEYLTEAKFVDQDYFQLLKQPLLEGTFFTASDIQNSNKVMIINDVFARLLKPSGDILGQQVKIFGDELFTIIGVVKGITIPGELEVPPRRYTPDGGARMNLMVTLKPGQKLTRSQVIKSLKEVNSQYQIFSLQQVSRLRDAKLFSQHATLLTTTAITLITLFLAGIGLYGILSYSSQVRRFEIGTRLALGAKRLDIIILIIRDNMLAINAGIFAGLLILFTTYLFFAQPLSPYISVEQIFIMLVTLLLVSAIALFACYWPLRQFINQPVSLALRGLS